MAGQSIQDKLVYVTHGAFLFRKPCILLNEIAWMRSHCLICLTSYWDYIVQHTAFQRGCEQDLPGTWSEFGRDSEDARGVSGRLQE